MPRSVCSNAVKSCLGLNKNTPSQTTALMACTLEEAKAAAVDGDFWLVLGLPFSATKNDVHRARRQLQLQFHADKGGDPEMSAQINAAADELLARSLPLCWSEQAILEIKRARRRETLERLAREEEIRQECIRHARMLRDTAHEDTVRLCHRRGARQVRELKLSQSAGNAFREIRYRIVKLQAQGRNAKARALVYATESEIAARRIARDETFPRVMGLETRQPQKAAKLAKLRTEHTRSWEQLRYLKKKGKLHRVVLLKLKRLRADAWWTLLELPPVSAGTHVIHLGEQ